MNGNGHMHPPQALIIEARPKTYSIDVRVFIATIMATMVVAFGAGLMMGPTDAMFALPVLSFLGIEVPTEELESAKQPEKIVGAMAKQSLMAPDSQPTNSNSKSATYMVGEISPNGEVIYNERYDGTSAADEVIIKQAKRTKTKNVATLGYKIRETHVNIDTPVLEGTGDVPHERDISYDRIQSDKGETEGNIRDQTMPSGQHLLVDMKNLEADFLNSEERLARAMQDSVTAAGLTMLSYHCHTLHPAGVSCVGVLLESHISFHTWPDEGVITLDMFTTSEKPLLPALPSIKELFGVPRINAETGKKEVVETVWSHELRGFRTEDARKVHHLDGSSDISKFVTSPLEVLYKEHVLNMQTEYTRIDIWDIKERDEKPGYEDGLRLGLKPQDPEWFSYEHASPTRILFLEGVLHIDNSTDQVFHEALVHPAMFAHPSPKSVGIIGGGDGGSLREVLKHKTVKEVTMVERDEKVVSVSKEYLPKASDCSDIVGSKPSCFDDKRLSLFFDDAFAYLKKTFGPNEAGKFDVLIADVNKPETQDEYTDADTVNALVDSLTPNGVIAIFAGDVPMIVDPRPSKGIHRKREVLTNLLEANPKIASIFVYEDALAGFDAPKAFLVACRDASCRKQWFGQIDHINFQVSSRMLPTKSKKPSLIQFDGATQRSYQIPPRAWESIYCRREPEPFECAYRGLDMTKDLFEYYPNDEEKSSFIIRESKEDAEEPAVFATVDIPEGSYIMPSHLAASLEVAEEGPLETDGTADKKGFESELLANYVDYISEYGHKAQDGSGNVYVEVGGSHVMRESDDSSKVNIRRWLPAHPSISRPKYSPVYDRHRYSFDVFLVASRDIKAGEEIVKPANLWN